VAEEVVQDTFESVFKEIGGFRGEASLKTWTYRILVNRARRVGKRESRTLAFSDISRARDGNPQSPIEEHLVAQSLGDPVHARPAADPQTEAINRQRLRILAEGLRGLPARQAEIVVLRDMEGRRSREVTELLDISTGNQRVLLHRGRTALRAVMAQRDEITPDRTSGEQLWN